MCNGWKRPPSIPQLRFPYTITIKVNPSTRSWGRQVRRRPIYQEWPTSTTVTDSVDLPSLSANPLDCCIGDSDLHVVAQSLYYLTAGVTTVMWEGM